MMELNKTVFLKERLLKFNLSEKEQNKVIENALKFWDVRFEFLSGKDIMPFLVKKGLQPEIAFELMRRLRIGKDLNREWKEILSNKGISLDFVQKYKNTLPTSPIGEYFNEFLNSKVQEIKH